jgi:hypothetical protein
MTVWIGPVEAAPVVVEMVAAHKLAQSMHHYKHRSNSFRQTVTYHRQEAYTWEASSLSVPEQHCYYLQ